jgi:hypothetical protein
LQSKQYSSLISRPTRINCLIKHNLSCYLNSWTVFWFLLTKNYSCLLKLRILEPFTKYKDFQIIQSKITIVHKLLSRLKRDFLTFINVPYTFLDRLIFKPFFNYQVTLPLNKVVQYGLKLLIWCLTFCNIDLHWIWIGRSMMLISN